MAGFLESARRMRRIALAAAARRTMTRVAALPHSSFGGQNFTGSRATTAERLHTGVRGLFPHSCIHTDQTQSHSCLCTASRDHYEDH